jgi:membrane protein DedA with SNARE-associated domain
MPFHDARRTRRVTIDRRLFGVLVYVVLTVAAASETTALPSAAAAKHAVANVAERAKPYLQHWGYAAIFATVAIEAVGIPAPGHTMVVASALAAARGTLDIRFVVLTAAVGTVLGSQIAWIVGARASAFLRRRSASLAARLTRTERLFRRWGAAVVVLGPFVEGIRQLNALAAGALNMPWSRFTLCNAAGTMLWIGVWGVGSWLLVDNVAGAVAVADNARPWLLGFSAAAVTAGALWAVWRYRRPAWRQRKRAP